MLYVPMYILILVSFLGCFSQTWGRLCLIMTFNSVFYVLVHHTLLTSWPFEIKYLGYFGALMSAAFGFCVVKFVKIPDVVDKELVDRDVKDSIINSALGISLLYLLSLVFNFSNQVSFNLGLPITSFFPSTFQGTIFLITCVQIILLRKGSWDGIQRVGSYIFDNLGDGRAYSGNSHHAKEIQKKRKTL